MAVAVPILAGIGGGAAAAALGAGTALSVGTGIATGAVTASLMKKGGAPAPAAVAPEAPPAPPVSPAAPSPPRPPRPPRDVSLQPGGAIAEVEKVAEQGRQSTILTSGRGIQGTEGTRAPRQVRGLLTAARELGGGLQQPQGLLA